MTTPSTEKHVPVTGKEEGELSASEDDVQPMQTSTSAPLTEHVSGPSANTSIQRRQAGNRGNNSNLVINFSDDDSGSESDRKGRTQTSKIKPKGTRYPSTLLQTKLKEPRQIDDRGINKKASSTITFTHAATSRVSNLSFAKDMKPNKNIHTFERKVSIDTRRPEQIREPNSNKLQDLRQQIALPESELKLKAAQPKKDAVNTKISPVRRLDGKVNFANELYGESLHLSKPGLGNNNDHAPKNLDGSIFGDSCGQESNGAQELDRESEVRRKKYNSAGYRDGIIAGQEAAAQQGYNIGYKESVLAGYKFGIVRGVSSALAFLPDELREKLIDEQETRDKFQELHNSVNALSTEVAMKMFYGTLTSKQGEEKSGEEAADSTGTATTDWGSYVTELNSLLEKSPKIEVKLDS